LTSFGEYAGLLAAACWATGSLIFSRIDAPAAAINLAKNLIAGVLLTATIPFLGSGLAVWTDAPASAYLWLLLSAVIGIQLGDAVYFRSIQILGPRRALVLTTMTPPISAVIGWYWLAEALDQVHLVAMALTLAGITFVVRDRSLASDRSGLHQGSTRDGILLGLLAAACQATGLAMAKVAMESMPALESSAMRIVGGFVGGLIVAVMTGSLGRWKKQLLADGVPLRVFVASFIGTYIGIWLSLISALAVPLAIATTQQSMTPVFMVILVAIFLRKTISIMAIAGMLAAIAGVALLMQPEILFG